MKEPFPMKIIAVMHSAFPEKFGIPRQSGLVEDLQSVIVFEPEYRNPDALRGLEGFSHLWLLWMFSRSVRADWSPTVRPPRLGGNTRMGVFATRSPFRPNPIGLSSVKLEKIEQHPTLGPILHVSGADLMDKTPIFDLKPYLPYTDAHPEAKGGFANEQPDGRLQVILPPHLEAKVPPEQRKGLLGVLAQDPRPAYQEEPDRVYGMAFGGQQIKFTVKNSFLTVTDIQ